MPNLYTVEMALTENDPDEVWEQWFKDMKPLASFVTVPGFISAQRLKGISTKPTPSIGYYRITEPAILDSDAYLANNGRKMNTPSWRPRMSYWYRNLFDGTTDPIEEGSILFTLDRDRPTAVEGLDFQWVKSIGLDQTTPYRGLAVLDEAAAAPLLHLEDEIEGLIAYRPWSKVYLFGQK